jgi:hypothetical protein
VLNSLSAFSGNVNAKIKPLILLHNLPEKGEGRHKSKAFLPIVGHRGIISCPLLIKK